MARDGDGPLGGRGDGATATAAGTYRNFLDAAIEASGSDAASIQVYDEERGALRLVGSRGLHPLSADFWHLVVPDSTCVCGMALGVQERVVVPDVAAEAAIAGSEDMHEFRRSRLTAVQSTPLLDADGRLLGMLSTHWRRAHEPSAVELRRIDSLARQCAATVTNERERLGHWQLVGPLLLREVNQRIREKAADFDAILNEEAPQEYLCECGCGGWVALAGSDFDASAAAGQPITVDGHLFARARAVRAVSQLLRDDATALRAEARQKLRKNDELARRRRESPPE